MSSAEEMLLLDGADFLTIGPVFGDTSATLGLEQFTALCSASACPVLAVGGVEPSQLLLLRAAGASGVAVIRSLLGAADVQSAAARLTAAWDASQERQSP